MQATVETKTGLSRGALQTIAAVAMLIDHCAIFWQNTIFYYIMKFIGKIAIVIMAYFVAEGYYKTQNIGKYILRMGVFAALSQIPYYLYKYGGAVPNSFRYLVKLMFYNRNVIFTLFVGLCLLTIFKSAYSILIKIIAFAAAIYLVRCSDWGYTAILWILGFGMFHGCVKKQNIWLCLVLALSLCRYLPVAIQSVIEVKALTYGALYCIVKLGSLMAIPLLMAYNGEKGSVPKWKLYVFYPLHLLVLSGLYVIFMK